MIAGRLTMLARVERNTATGIDSWGNPVAPAFTVHHAALPCFVWSKAASERADGTKSTSTETFGIMIGRDADLRADDEIAIVMDRLGRTLIPGRLKVEGPVQFKHTHREAALERIA
ncbi:hypothetical protein [Erythrobacter sp. WG]|uniref:hypothetical protein n=1 Tax=Erythrobacter sp. WG TaxID=2985510 RepID=UPI00226E04AC|nr:hypothetical protein [Erythrobacter sp. WG]MCX9146617.1 hypothetical protein [Erythrobacter sp. WG]